jgi:thioredoxin reductase (NADPH)
MGDWAVIIVGAGLAGLAAGIYAVRSGLKTLVFDEQLVGGNIMGAPKVENYPVYRD